MSRDAALASRCCPPCGPCCEEHPHWSHVHADQFGAARPPSVRESSERLGIVTDPVSGRRFIAEAGVAPFDDDIKSPFEDLEDENADLRMMLAAASDELARLRKAAQAVVDWYDGPPYVYLEEEMVRQVDVLRAALQPAIIEEVGRE